jgi:type I site-specific restriction-modification system R (restriction) subunit
MKALLPNAMLIGFTGTPLLKDDKRRSIETFGPYIHTYKYDEAVEDSVVLDLRYEARDVNQELTSQEQVDDMYRVDQFEWEVQRLFIEKPAEMKLLIVVDKLLTGFDAPPATYLYIDKHMQDHGLFQAICRVNRLDGEDKEFGYIVDYQDLFRSLEQAITDYTSEAFENFDAEDVQGLLTNRLQKGRERLEETREKVKALCEPVDPPRDSAAYIRFFCAQEDGNLEQLEANAQKRVNLCDRPKSKDLGFCKC